MARLTRLYLPGCAQHVIQWGNSREACFCDEADYKAYLSFLKDAAVKYQVAVHAFVLTTNHVHLLVTPSDEQGLINGVSVIDCIGQRTMSLRRGEGRKLAAFQKLESMTLTPLVFGYVNDQCSSHWEGKMVLILLLLKHNKYWLLANLICFIPFLYFSSWFRIPAGYDGSPVGIGDFMVMGETLFPIWFLCSLINSAWLYKVVRSKKDDENPWSFILFYSVIVLWAGVLIVNYMMRFNYYAP